LRDNNASLTTFPFPRSQSDGTKIGFASQRLFDTTGKDDEVVNAMARENIGIGSYGSASAGTDATGQQAPKRGLFHDFKVQVKRSCDDDDPEAHL
jgi:hypothetical protein